MIEHSANSARSNDGITQRIGSKHAATRYPKSNYCGNVSWPGYASRCAVIEGERFAP
ncbi:hypothetical protein ALTERO38_50012 [Alteromonas sp. 38]|nr:hypothetical protein ALTER154_90220 [Alteromonas sp. 154]VXB16606.1 hypothetical protein ALTERO38_50012 [Alteromonas sp. 38]